MKGSRGSKGWRAAAAGIALAALAFQALIPHSGLAQRYLPGADPAHPRIRYADSLDSPNDRCIVAGNKLNLKVRPVYVNGVPIGFC